MFMFQDDQVKYALSTKFPSNRSTEQLQGQPNISDSNRCIGRDKLTELCNYIF